MLAEKKKREQKWNQYPTQLPWNQNKTLSNNSLELALKVKDMKNSKNKTFIEKSKNVLVYKPKQSILPVTMAKKVAKKLVKKKKKVKKEKPQFKINNNKFKPQEVNSDSGSDEDSEQPQTKISYPSSEYHSEYEQPIVNIQKSPPRYPMNRKPSKISI